MEPCLYSPCVPCLSPCRDVPGGTKESQHSAQCLVLCRTEDSCPLTVVRLASLRARARAGVILRHARHSKSGQRCHSTRPVSRIWENWLQMLVEVSGSWPAASDGTVIVNYGPVTRRKMLPPTQTNILPL